MLTLLEPFNLLVCLFQELLQTGNRHRWRSTMAFIARRYLQDLSRERYRSTALLVQPRLCWLPKRWGLFESR